MALDAPADAFRLLVATKFTGRQVKTIGRPVNSQWNLVAASNLRALDRDRPLANSPKIHSTHNMRHNHLVLIF